MFDHSKTLLKKRIHFINSFRNLRKDRQLSYPFLHYFHHLLLLFLLQVLSDPSKKIQNLKTSFIEE